MTNYISNNISKSQRYFIHNEFSIRYKKKMFDLNFSQQWKCELWSSAGHHNQRLFKYAPKRFVCALAETDFILKTVREKHRLPEMALYVHKEKTEERRQKLSW
jgi:hypothetical protein